MVTAADIAAFQQQLRQEVTDVLEQLRAKVNDTISGRMDMLNSINRALQNVSAGPAENKPNRSSDLIARNRKGNNEKKECSGALCQTCTCGCKHGQIKERRCLPSSKAPTSWTTTRLRLIAQSTSSDRWKHPNPAQNDSKQTSH